MQRSRGTLAARNITKSYGDTVVLERLSLTVTPSGRIGVVGPNGIGKSTLLRLLAGVEKPDSGAISREPPDLTVAYLAQERQAAELSGGEAARQKLETILAADAEVLLLDEPTNDLDFAALELLDRFVARHRGGLVVVSHDRAFLEGMTSRDPPCTRIRRRLAALCGATRRSTGASGIGVCRVHREARAGRGTGSAHAPVGGTRLRPRPKEEEIKRCQESRREEARARRAGRETVVTVAPPAQFRGEAAGRRCRRPARTSGD